MINNNDVEITKELRDVIFKNFLVEQDSMRLGKPKIYVVAGGPGSGKTTFRRKAFDLELFNKNMHLHEPDEVMLAIPEYKKAIEGKYENYDEYISILSEQREKWKNVALKLANEMLEIEVNKRSDIIYERTCALDESYDFLKKAKESGYEIVFSAFYTDINTALERTKARVLTEHRILPDYITIERTEKLSKLFPKYKALADKTFLYKSIDDQFSPVEDYSEFLAIGQKFPSFHLFNVGYILEKVLISPVISFSWDKFSQNPPEYSLFEYFNDKFTLYSLTNICVYNGVNYLLPNYYSIANKFIISNLITDYTADLHEMFSPGYADHILQITLVAFSEFAVANIVTTNHLFNDNYLLQGAITGIAGDGYKYTYPFAIGYGKL